MQAYYSQAQADFYRDGREAQTGEKYRGLNIYKVVGQDLYITLTSIKPDAEGERKWPDMKSIARVDDYAGMASIQYTFFLAVPGELKKALRRGKLEPNELEEAKERSQNLIDSTQ